MKIEPTHLSCMTILEPQIFSDARGIFFEVFKEDELKQSNVSFQCVQINQSMSKRGVLRGLHFQRPPMSQAKLVRVLKGVIWDVCVDIDSESPTFGQWAGVELSEDNRRMALLSDTAAHGFYVLSEYAVVEYLCSQPYSPAHDAGIAWDDPRIGIDWKVDSRYGVILSEKDKDHPLLF